MTKQGLLRLLTLQAHTRCTPHAHRTHTHARARTHAHTHAVQGTIIDRVKPLGACGQVALCAGYAPLPSGPIEYP